MMSTKTDITFQDTCLIGSKRWTCARLGLSVDMFMRKKDALETAGFPKEDPILKAWIKADVDAWVTKRRKIKEVVVIEEVDKEEGINWDAI